MKILATVYDRATQAHGPIMTFNARGEAMRSFRDAVNDPQQAMHKHPTDFEFWIVGQYDEQSGTITRTERELLARAEDHKEA